jgi:hypothetical protein
LGALLDFGGSNNKALYIILYFGLAHYGTMVTSLENQSTRFNCSDSHVKFVFLKCF